MSLSFVINKVGPQVYQSVTVMCLPSFNKVSYLFIFCLFVCLLAAAKYLHVLSHRIIYFVFLHTVK